MNNWKDIFPSNSIYFESDNGILYNGNVLNILKSFPDNCIDTIITSPPYWGVRFYGNETNTVWGGDINCDHEWDVETVNIALSMSDKSKLDEYVTGFCKKCGAWYGQLGLEPTFYMYLEHLSIIFKEIYRILKPTGTLWVNIGDTYFSKSKGSGGVKSKKLKIKGKNNFQKFNPVKISMNYPEKSLCMIPSRFAINMIDMGFILRNIIIWRKPNAMPSSIKDRFTVDFEYIYFFVKQKKYYFNQILEPLKHNMKNVKFGGNKAEGYNSNTYSGNLYDSSKLKGKNKRTVWDISTKGFKGEHFAPFPIDLPKISIDAGCPNDGIVFDPFMGSGTTALASIELNRKWIGIEINDKYCNIIKDRINNR